MQFRVARLVKNRSVYIATANQYNIYDGGGVDGCKRAALDGLSHEYLRKAIPKMMIATASRSSLARLTMGNRPALDARNRLPGIMSVRVPQDPPSSCTLRLLSPFVGHCLSYFSDFPYPLPTPTSFFIALTTP